MPTILEILPENDRLVLVEFLNNLEDSAKTSKLMAQNSEAFERIAQIFKDNPPVDSYDLADRQLIETLVAEVQRPKISFIPHFIGFFGEVIDDVYRKLSGGLIRRNLRNYWQREMHIILGASS